MGAAGRRRGDGKRNRDQGGPAGRRSEEPGHFRGGGFPDFERGEERGTRRQKEELPPRGKVHRPVLSGDSPAFGNGYREDFGKQRQGSGDHHDSEEAGN